MVSLPLVFALTFQPGQSGPADRQALLQQKAVLERILAENIVPFWYPEVLDLEAGGYRLNHDLEGNWMGPHPKVLVTQARTVWFFSQLVNYKKGPEEHLEAARHGFHFLRDHLWDHKYGGFFWEVDYTGKTPTRPNKHLYGLSFGLYALSEYYMASGDSEARELADRLFDLLEKHAHDKSWGGYREYFLRDWSAPPGSERGYMQVTPEIKLMNTHLHLMEAFTTYYKATRRPLARERLAELVAIQSNAVVRKNLGACTDKYQQDWTPVTGPQFDRVSYGHDIENVWLLVDANEALGLNNGPYLDLFRTLVDYSLRFGFDWENGGFYYAGDFNRQADNLDKSWWVQAEALVSLLTMYLLTGDERYQAAFSKSLEWTEKHQVDWNHGDWFGNVSPDGQPSGDKAGAWKSPYHNGRAVLRASDLISRVLSRGGAEE